MSKYLISGAHGLIGTHLFLHLLKSGHQVKAIPREYLYNYFALKDFFKLEQPDYIIHLASWGNHSGQTDLDKIVASNINYTTTLLQASKDIDYKCLINIGSSSEYGLHSDPMSEDDCLNTNTYYGASKVATTYISRAFAIQENKPVITIRPFSVYGDKEAFHRFIPTVITHALEGRSFPLAEKPRHDWIYIDDFISGLLLVLKHGWGLKGEVVNIGTGSQYSNLEVVEKIEKIHGSKIEYDTTEKLRSYDSQSWVSDNTLLIGLGWEQKYSLDQGLKRVYDYIK